MRIMVFLLLLGVVQVMGKDSYSQNARVSLNMDDVTLGQVLNTIEDQSEFYFIFNQKLVDVNRKVSVHIENEKINDVLNELFRGTDIQHMVLDRQIVLSPKPLLASTMKEIQRIQQQFTVSGQVTDEKGEALPGVNIMEKGTSNGTITDTKGNYSLKVSSSDAVLVFSFVGYKDQEVPIGGKSVINVSLKPAVIGIDEVVTVGYGTSSKRKTVSAISTVQVDKIQNVPVATLGDRLAGRTNGVLVVDHGGGPGKVPVISIRGGGTPLVVIDGIVSSMTDFQNLNPADIENISILKDAESAAIYGARAGNGIIVVKTKKGEAGKTNITYDYSLNLAQPTILPRKLNSYEVALRVNEARQNDGQAPAFTPEEIQKFKDQSDPYNYPNTDWQKLCLKTFANTSRHNLSMSGGNEKTKYFASIGYYDQGTIYTYNTNWLKRTNYRLSVTDNFEKIGLTANLNLFGVMEKFRIPASQYGSGYYFVWGHIQNSGPMELAYTDLGLYSGKGDHPLVEMDPRSGYNRRETRNFNGILDLAWKVPGVKGLMIKAINQYSMNNRWTKFWNATAPQYPLHSDVPIKHSDPRLSSSGGNGYSLNNQFYAQYEGLFAEKHSVAATFGYEQTYGYGESVNATRIGYKLLFDQFIAGPTANSTNGGNTYEYGRAGFFGRVSYDFDKKYFIEGSFRHDGSDWFPEDKRWGTFWSGGAGWIVSKEGFMSQLDSKNIINYLKFRGSIGTVGLDGSSANISRFQYIPGYYLIERAYLINNSFVQGFREGPLPSPDLTWYTQVSRNIGFDFASLGSRLSGSFDYFYMTTTGMLASPSGTIYSDPLGIALPARKSDGKLRRAGFEFNLTYKNHIGAFQYEAGTNFTKFDQLWEVNPYEDVSVLKNPYLRTTHQTGYFGVGYHTLGYYESADDVMNTPKFLTSTNLVPGDIKYEDTNGDGKIDNADKRRIGKSSFPRVNYGIYFDLRYKGWFLNTLFQGSGNKDLYPGNVIREAGVYVFQQDYWKPDNTDAKYPRLMSSGSYNGRNNYQGYSDFWLVNARYFRLKSLQLGYDLKHSLLKNVPFIGNFTIILNGSNLFTISESIRKYKMDPEVGSNNNYDYPTERIYALTVRLGF